MSYWPFSKSSGVPPFPPLPMEPLFSGDQPYLDQFGRAKTVRVGKWRCPPEKDDGDELAANFFEFKLQKQAHKKLASQRASVFIYLFISSVQLYLQEEEHSTPGLIRKLKLSGELRSKLEMAHSKKNSKQKQVGEEGSTEEDSSQGPVTQLSEHRKMLLQKQLCKFAKDYANGCSKEDETDRVRRVSAQQMLDQRPRSSSSPPNSCYSPSSTPNMEARKISENYMSRIFSSQSQLIDKSNFINLLSDSDTQMKPTKKIYFIDVLLSELVSYLAIHLIFDQIVRDTEDPECLCLLKNKRMKMKQKIDNIYILARFQEQTQYKIKRSSNFP
ncbi:hypothetical protein QYM36_013523 [Artemia franciscana]|uniref:Uncharacterized protein n=1 Tax=Artemia franciscana TaxID=6661 RepID=A0AA88HMQ7_ARTSF|nr:hypothetical protein QYM36_013523 [Artemia franciscana]